MDATFERLYKSGHVKISGKVCEASNTCLSSFNVWAQGTLQPVVFTICWLQQLFFWIREDPWWRLCCLVP